MNMNSCGYRLQSCVWELTLACCFSCKYCGSRAGKAREGELSTAECLDVAKQLADMGCRRVSLIGGEIFMRRDWAEIVRALTSRGIKTAIVTNGFLFTDKIVKELVDSDIESVGISIDGPEHVHDSFREKGSFQRAMRAIDILSASGIPVSVITTLHSANVSSLEEMYTDLQKKDIFAWQLQACSPMGNAAVGECRSDDAVTHASGRGSQLKAVTAPQVNTDIDFSRVIEFVEKHLDNPHFSIGIADNIGYYTEEEGRLRGDTSGEAFYGGCQAGLTAIGIDSVGNVRGCESMYDDFFYEGNLRDKSLSEIWNAPGAFAYNRQFTLDQLSGACGECPYSSRCAGGCRSYNYFTHGKLYESLRCARRSRGEL